MKKITSVLLCMVLVLSMFCVNAAAAQSPCMEAGVTVLENGTVIVAVRAKQAAANARLTVDFDSDCLRYNGCETAFAVHSVAEGEEKVTAGLANASAKALQAGEELIAFRFEMTGSWSKTVVTVTAESFGGKKVNESLALVVEKTPVIAEGWSGYTLWELTADGTLTVSPSGQLYDGKCNMKHYWKVDGVLTLPWTNYADRITRVVIEEGVDSIGQMAFYEMPSLQEVVLPESLSKIYGYAFKNDTALTAINLGHVTYVCEGAFYGCTSLEVVELPEGATVEDWAFSKVPGYRGAN